MAERVMTGFPTREEALADFFKAWRPPFSFSGSNDGIELVDLDSAVGRILAKDLKSQSTLPVVRASGLDGIAVKSSAFLDGWPDTTRWTQGVDYVRADTGDDFDDAFDADVEGDFGDEEDF